MFYLIFHFIDIGNQLHPFIRQAVTCKVVPRRHVDPTDLWVHLKL